MKIGFIGVGNIGGALARHAVAHGHNVYLSNSRGPETLTELVSDLGPLATAVRPADVLLLGDLIVVSVPLKAIPDLPTAGTLGKPLIDTCNYYPERDGQVAQIDDGSTTESELVAAHFKEAHVVKAFNAITAKNLAEGGKPYEDPARLSIPIAGDHEKAKLLVARFAHEIGFDSVNTGDLASGKLFENGGRFYGAEMTGDEMAAALTGATS